MRRRLLAAAAAFLAVACGDRDPQRAGARARGSEPFVLFLAREVWLDQLGVPVDAPVAPGSTPSRKTMRSDDERVVDVDASGRLVGRGNGTTTVRNANGGSTLRVVVLVTDALRLDPASVPLQPGGTAALVARASSGVVVPPERVTWWADRSDLVSAAGGVITARGAAGTALVHARYGGAEAVARVEIGGTPDALALVPRAPDLRVGSLARFKVLGTSGSVNADWSSRPQSVVKHVGGGVFQALAAGQAQVCAATPGQELCEKVRVRK